MTSSDSTPKLPIWIFALTDAALLGAAVLVATQAPRPLSATAILAIVACVIAGAVVLLVPLVAHYERQKNETLDERQRALEALAVTVSTSAEQISIAANGLHEIAALAQKNLREAEQLPQTLQAKLAEFQRLTSTSTAEKKALGPAQANESERLESVATKIAKTAAEFSKLEAATQQHLTAANEAIAKLSMGTAAAIGKAQVAAEQALTQARTEAARSLGEAAGNATRAIETAKTSALADIDAKLGAASSALIERLIRELTAKLGNNAPAITDAPAPTAPAATTLEASVAGTDVSAGALAKSESTAHPPKRPRKPRREEPEEPTVADAPTSATPAPAPESNPISAAAETSLISPKDEPPPIPSDKISEVTPVAPHTAQPFSEPVASESTPSTPPANPPTPSEVSSTPIGDPATQAPKIPRRRVPKKSEPESTSPDAEKGELDLGLPDAAPANGTAEKTLSSDGATRLLVTAYIGIGNRLFIRGSGPGLTWEKGVPLQFVSIGKWRWETNDASTAVQFKLYKNDDIECAALGTQSVEPGYQQEVTAAF